MALEDGLDGRPVALGRHDHPAGTLHRLADHGRDRVGAFILDRLLQLVDQHLNEAVLVEVVRPAVRVRRREVQEPGRSRAEMLPEGRHSSCRERAHRDAVVAHHAGENLDLLVLPLDRPVVAGDLERRLVGFGAARGELEVVDRPGVDLRQLGGQLDGRRRRQPEEGRRVR